MERREFLKNLAFSPFMESVAQTRKDTGTQHLQSLMIKALWELSRKLGTIMFCYFPEGFWDEDMDVYYPSTKLQVITVSDTGITLQTTQENGNLTERFKWLKFNSIEFVELPETINFHGVLFPIVKIFRLEIPKKL